MLLTPAAGCRTPPAWRSSPRYVLLLMMFTRSRYFSAPMLLHYFSPPLMLMSSPHHRRAAMRYMQRVMNLLFAIRLRRHTNTASSPTRRSMPLRRRYFRHGTDPGGDRSQLKIPRQPPPALLSAVSPTVSLFRVKQRRHQNATPFPPEKSPPDIPQRGTSEDENRRRVLPARRPYQAYCRHGTTAHARWFSRTSAE